MPAKDIIHDAVKNALKFQIPLLIVNLKTEEIMKRSNERSEINGQNDKISQYNQRLINQTC
jgi:hypothetical protein